MRLSLNDGGRYFNCEDSFLRPPDCLTRPVRLGETSVQVESRGHFYQRLEGTFCGGALAAKHSRLHLHILSEPSTDGTGRFQTEVSSEGEAGRFLCGGREDGEKARGKSREPVWPQGGGQSNGGPASHLVSSPRQLSRVEELAHCGGLVGSNTLGRLKVR